MKIDEINTAYERNELCQTIEPLLNYDENCNSALIIINVWHTRQISANHGYDVSQEIRNDHLKIEEGKKLIKKYDGEFPDRYFSETMSYLGIKKSFFLKTCDKYRSPHLWKKIGKNWALRHTANKDGTDD